MRPVHVPRLLLAVMLLAGCSGEPGSEADWVDAGRELGERLAADGRARDLDNCDHAIRRYRSDVGWPTERANRHAMMRGCLGR